MLKYIFLLGLSVTYSLSFAFGPMWYENRDGSYPHYNKYITPETAYEVNTIYNNAYKQIEFDNAKSEYGRVVARNKAENNAYNSRVNAFYNNYYRDKYDHESYMQGMKYRHEKEIGESAYKKAQPFMERDVARSLKSRSRADMIRSMLNDQADIREEESKTRDRVRQTKLEEYDRAIRSIGAFGRSPRPWSPF